MSTSIADLKAMQAKMLEKIKKTVADKGQNSYEDDRIWNVTFDKEKGGSAVIRFLPSPDGGSEMPYTKVIRHFFQGSNGQYYTEKSLRTLQKPDPVADLNYRLYNSKVKSNMDQASNQKQKPRFYSNILVIKDPANRENEGKVFLYEYGPAIDNLIQESLFPDAVLDPDAESVNPFNVFEAPNLLIKVKPQQLGKNIVPNYEKTAFDHKVTELDGEIAEIVNKGHSLKEFTDPTTFKTFEELGKKLVAVLGAETGNGVETVQGWENGVPTPTQVAQTNTQSAPAESVAETVKETVSADVPESDSDEDAKIAELRKLMEE